MVEYFFEKFNGKVSKDSIKTIFELVSEINKSVTYEDDIEECLSEDDDEIYSNMDNNIPCTDTNTIIFFTDIMSKDILPLIIDFYEYY